MPRAGTECPAGRRGFTLPEVLISTALFSVVVLGIYLVHTALQEMMDRGEMKAEVQQNARVAGTRMTQELRMAGYDPENALLSLSPRTFLRAGGLDCVSFVTYARDEQVTPPVPYSAQVTYATESRTESHRKTITLRRRSDRWDAANARFPQSEAGFQPLALLCNEPAGSTACDQVVSFVYFDADNRVLTPVAAVTQQRCPPQIGAPSATQTLLSFAQLRQVRRIVVTLRSREVRSKGQEVYTVTNDVVFRN